VAIPSAMKKGKVLCGPKVGEKLIGKGFSEKGRTRSDPTGPEEETGRKKSEGKQNTTGKRCFLLSLNLFESEKSGFIAVRN